MSDHNTTVSVLTSGTATSQVTVQSSALRNILAELIAGVNRHEDLIAALQTRCTIPVPLLPDSTTHPIPDTELRWRLFSATVVALQEQIAVLREQQAVFMSADRTGRSVSYYQRSPIRSGSPVTMMATTTAGAGTSSNRMWLTTASLQELEGGGGDSKPPVVTPEEKLYKKLERTLQKELHDLRQRVEVLDNRVSSFLVASLNSVSNLKGVSEDVAHLREEHQISQKESERSFRAVTQKADAACKSAESVARDLQQVHALADSLQGQLKTLQSAVAAQQKAAPGLTRKESMALKAETTKEVKDAEARWNKTMESKMGEVRHELTALRNVADAAVKRASVVTPSSPPPTPHSPSTSRPQQPQTVTSSVPLSPAAKDSDDLVRAELTKLRLDMAKAILDHELTHHRHQLLSIPAAPNANSALLNGAASASPAAVAAVSGSKNGTVPPPGSSPVGAAVGNPPVIPPLNNQVNASFSSQGVVAGKPFTAAPPLSSSSQSTGGGGGGGTESMISRAAPPKGGPSSNVDTNDRSSSGLPPPAVGERTPPPPPSLLVQQQQQPSSDQPLTGGGAAPYATKVLYGAAAPSGAVVTPRGAVRPQSAQPMRGRPLVMTRSIVPEDSITSSSSAVGNAAVYLGSSPRQPPPPPSAPNHTAVNVSATATTADRTVAPTGGGKPTRPLSAGVLQQASLTFKLGKASTPSSTTVVGFTTTSEGGTTTSTPQQQQQRQAPPATAVANSPIHHKAPTIRPTSAPADATQTGSVEAAATTATTNGTSSSSAGAVGLSFVAAMPPHEPGTCVVYKCHYCKDK